MAERNDVTRKIPGLTTKKEVPNTVGEKEGNGLGRKP